MASLRCTVIAKTDICGFTPLVKKLSEAELRDLLDRHKQFIADIVTKNEGVIVKGEGDSFWIIFPSVTVAALAAVEMHQQLRAQQSGKGDHERLAIRVAITLGDVLHHDRDIFGDSVNLAARIESITPSDETFLSHAAWLALNKAEVQTSFVNEFPLKGMSTPEKIYKVRHEHKTRIVTHQVIVVTDVKGFTAYQQASSVADIEKTLMALDALENKVCASYGGTIRILAGDTYYVTFGEARQALAAMQDLCDQWQEYIQQNHVPCGLRIGVHQGDLRVFRAWIYGAAINQAVLLADLDHLFAPEKDTSSVWVTESIKQEVAGTNWEPRLQRVDRRQLPEQVDSIFKENDVYRFVIAHS